MTHDQTIVFAVIGLAMLLFMFGRWRHDVVALMALVSLVFLGVIPGKSAFSGFGHSAVITVAAVLVISRGLRNAGVVEGLTRGVTRLGGRPCLQMLALTGAAALCSAFMNNVGALALFMPVALDVARRSGRSPTWVLMPLAFSTILGGLGTMIGTPPNIIIAGYLEELRGEPFGLFDFAPVGGIIALVGVIFLSTIGWRLLPHRRRAPNPADDLFHIDEYITEVRLLPGSPWHDRSVAQLVAACDVPVDIAGIIRGKRLRVSPPRQSRLRDGDILILRADPARLPKIVDGKQLEVIGRFDGGIGALRGSKHDLLEAVVVPDSFLVGRTPRAFRSRSSTTLLAVARQGRPLRKRMSQVRFEGGDVLLLHGPTDSLNDAIGPLGLLPLARRVLRLGAARRPAVAVGLFVAALAAAAAGVVPGPVAFTSVVVAYIVGGQVALREIYETIDWSVVVLLGAMLPVGGALQDTGATEVVSAWLRSATSGLEVAPVIGIVIVATMALSDFMNNSATALIMAPIAAGLAHEMNLAPEPFLMAVSIGASCAFLTPLGHHCNTLVLGPGGYRFGDFWRVGLALDVVIVIFAVPAIIWLWPLLPALPA